MDHITATITSVGTTFVESAVTAVRKFSIRRARAEIVEGNATQVALSIREISGPDDVVDIVLEYSLTDNPIDSAEEIFFKSQVPATSNSGTGTVFIAVKCDTIGNTVRVSLDIEQIQ